MATLPPRKHATSVTASKSAKQNLTPMQILLQMGFPKQRAEKALSATGNRGVQLAADWLLAHVNDPTLDSNLPREYVLYLCPVGVLFDQLQAFWTSSLLRCGRNGAHNQLPHVTLCSFFKAPDDAVPHLTQSLRKIVEKFQHLLPEKLTLDLYTSTNFFGFFIADDEADILKNVAVQFISEAKNFLTKWVDGGGDSETQLTECFPWCTRRSPVQSKFVKAEPATKALHLTLAYQFPTEHYNVLNELAGAVDTNAMAGWELRLYSRDPRLAGNEVHRVIYSHVPQELDELELLIGDFVYVNPDQLNPELSPDGWVQGTSWLSGVSGTLPKNYIEHTPESDAWTLHRSILLTRGAILDDAEGSMAIRRLPSSSLKFDGHRSRSRRSNLNPGGGGGTNSNGHEPNGTGAQASSPEETRMSIYENVDVVNLKPSSKSKTDPSSKPKTLRWMLTVRHGERMDFTFGAWIPFCFDENGTYIRKDLNMPKSVPPRKGGPQDYDKDSPLTEMGHRQAFITGEAMKEHGMTVDHVFCSPALRCVQTCTDVLKGLDLHSVRICIEPGLFEWLAWYPDSRPEWMSVQELCEAGFTNVDTHYKPLISVEELHNSQETSEQYYMRSYYVSQNIIKLTSEKGGNILVVGHAATLDTCTRQMCGSKPRCAADLIRLAHRIPYCSVSMAEESANGGPWNLVAPPFPGLMHSANTRYDWKVLLG